MAQLQSGDFNGLSCVWLANDQIRLAMPTGWGPRVLFYGWQNGENLFAEVPDLAEPTPHGQFHFLGGHRLWYGPEAKSTTYWPDEWPITIAELEHGARFTAPADGLGIVKELEIELASSQPHVRLNHVLRNTGSSVIELAPWALSMFRLGGVGLYPQPQGPVDPDSLLPNRHYTFWPYSDPADVRLVLGKQLCLLHGRPGSAFKFGYRSDHDWLAYWLDGTLCVIHFKPQQNVVYPDMGCNVESFVKDRFLELETLSPLVRLKPGESVVHEERWQLYANIPPLGTEEGAVAAASTLGLWP